MSQLVLLSSVSPEIMEEIVYATPHNFTGQILYPRSLCYLQKNVAQRLHKVFLRAQKMGYGLKVLDGYRPLSVQKKMWELVPDPRYVADPNVGSKHNRGAAIDLTLIDSLRRQVPMPSQFDEFSEKAHRNYEGSSEEALFYKNLLEELMVAEGFLPFPTEWWHFDAPDWQLYPVLNISFEDLERQ